MKDSPARYVAKPPWPIVGRTNVLTATLPVAGITLAIALLVAPARAQAIDPIRLEYAATTGCPSAETFLDQLRARSPRIRLSKGTERARTLVVRIAPRPRSIVGRLTVRELDGSEAERSVAGESCTEVASGLALIAAVALDPAAVTLPEQTDAGAPAVSESATEAIAKESPGDKAPVPAAPPVPPVDSAVFKTAQTPAHAPATRRDWQLSLGAHGELGGGPLPNLLVAVPVFFEVSRASDSLFAFAARARFERAGSGVVGSSAGDARFTWTAGSLDLCPLSWSRAALRLTPCARTEAGALAAIGVNVQPVRNSVRPWLTLGPVARGRWMFLAPVFLELEAALLVPIVRDRYFVEPAGTVFRPALVGWSASVGLGVAIW